MTIIFLFILTTLLFPYFFSDSVIISYEGEHIGNGTYIKKVNGKFQLIGFIGQLFAADETTNRPEKLLFFDLEVSFLLYPTNIVQLMNVVYCT